MSSTEYIDLPLAGWFALDVMRTEARKWDWVALLIDIPPDDFENCTSGFPAWFNSRPKDWPGKCEIQQRWFRIPGKHRNKDAAWDALEDVMATRH